MLQRQPAVMGPRRLGQIPGGREDHRGRLSTGEEVQEQRNRRGGEPEKGPRGGETDHARPVERTSAWRSASPKGVSVVTRS